nr:MAG TPA: hypothetical protein [Caudoviricetes sp.]
MWAQLISILRQAVCIFFLLYNLPLFRLRPCPWPLGPSGIYMSSRPRPGAFPELHAKIRGTFFSMRIQAMVD